MEAYTLDTVHEEIRSIYEFYNIAAPGITPLEVGHLGALWGIADQLHDEAEDA